jgi:hypothetical protein
VAHEVEGAQGEAERVAAVVVVKPVGGAVVETADMVGEGASGVEVTSPKVSCWPRRCALVGR